MRKEKVYKPKHSKEAELFFEKEDLRWATNEAVADYRAERLKCKVIVDIGCGIGFQAFSFARTCKKVYAIEIDEKKLGLAKKNAKALGIDNIEFIHGDALDLSVIKQLKDVEVVFCDPERLPEEAERKLSTIKPDVKELLVLYKQVTSRIAIEFPPQIKEIPFDCEKEYVSLDGKLNRLTLYFGGLKKSESSAVSLPAKERIDKVKGFVALKESVNHKDYLFEVDPAVVKAGLLAELSEITGASFLSAEKQVFFTGEKIISSPFFISAFKVLGSCPFRTENIIRILRRNHAGRVVLRYNIEPRRYWKERKTFEDAIEGPEKLCLFRFGGHAVVAKIILGTSEDDLL